MATKPELYGVDDDLPEDLDTERDDAVPVGPIEDPTTADDDVPEDDEA